MPDSLPLISCLCITGNSTSLLKRAVDCFKNQNYPNKELLLVYERHNIATNEYVGNLHDPEIVALPIPEGSCYSLGAKRNYSIEKSNGEYFCQWDDDDWYHPDRLTAQLEPLLKSYKKASILIYEVVFDEIKKAAYGSTIRPLEHSILCRRSVFTAGFRYSDKNKGEDFDFIRRLLKENLVFPVINPGLYIYVYHGKNTFDQEHFKAIFDFSYPLTDTTSACIANILSGNSSMHDSALYLKSEEFLSSFHYFNRFPYK